MAPTAVAEKETTERPAAAPTAPLEKKPRRLLVIIGIVVVLITAQAVITYLLMPKDSGKTDEAAVGNDSSGKASRDRLGKIGDDTVEVPIGDFNCTNSTAGQGMVVHVDFKLAATTQAKHADHLTAQLKKYQGRARQVVNKIVRSSSMTDLNDPNLGTIKRLIREEVNRMLSETLVVEVIISDMRTIQQ